MAFVVPPNAVHIGMGADYYDSGESSMSYGLEDITRYPVLFAELLRRGYSDEDVKKIFMSVAVKVRPSPEVEIVGLHAVRRFALAEHLISRRQAHLQRCNDLGGDVVL